MRVSFSPVAALPSDKRRLTISKTGESLIINGDPIDLSAVPDGATLPAGAIDSEWIVGPVERIGGVLHVTLLLPHGPNPSQAVAFPEPITVTDDGPVAIPSDPEQEEDHGDD